MRSIADKLLTAFKKDRLTRALGLTLARFLAPPEVDVPGIKDNKWFRETALPIAHAADGHVLAVTSALATLVKGRLGLAIAWLFGAGKTRSVALISLALLAIEPGVKILVICKEKSVRLQSS